MIRHATNLECSLACPWRGTSRCLRLLVSEAVLLGAHLGQGQMAGVRALYYPHELPPCVSPDGHLHWDSVEDEPEPEPLHWGDGGPAL
jgi:hypothetical protein